MADLDLSLASHMAYVNADLAVTSSELDIIASVGSGHAVEIDSLVVSNVHATDTDTVTVKRYIGATGTEICKAIEISKGASLVVVSKNNVQRLNEGDKITIQGAAASGKLKALANGRDYY